MITRAKLVEQLREHQIRSAQSYSAALAVFSPNPHIASRRDLKVALVYAVLFCFLMASCYVTLYLKWFRLSAMFVIFGILLPCIWWWPQSCRKMMHVVGVSWNYSLFSVLGFVLQDYTTACMQSPKNFDIQYVWKIITSGALDR